MSAHKLRVGVIGTGMHAVAIHIPNLRNTGRAEIVAICRRNRAYLAMAQQELDVPEAYTDWQELLDAAQLDAVVVCTPPDVHAQPTIAALERGLHVLVEKPMALSNSDAQAMVTAAEQAQRTLMVGYDVRGMSSWRTVKQVLSAGVIGSIRQVHACLACDLRALWLDVPFSEEFQTWLQSPGLAFTFRREVFRRGGWRVDPEKVGVGMFSDVGSHLVDLLLWMAGAPATQASAFRQELADGHASVISAQALLANGISLSVMFNDYVANGPASDIYGYGGRLTVFGDSGVLTADWSGIMKTPATQIWLEHAGRRTQLEPQGETISPAAAFVATVLDGTPNLAPASEAARTVAFTEAVYRSAAEARIVAVGEPMANAQ